MTTVQIKATPAKANADQAASQSGDVARLAGRYAVALYELMTERKQLEAAVEQVRQILAFVNTNVDWQGFIRHPRMPMENVQRGVAALIAYFTLDGAMANFIRLVAKNRRLSYLSHILESFLREHAKRRGEHSGMLRVAHALTAPQLEAISATLGDLVGGRVHLTVSEDPSLLGGFVVKVGSRLIDTSVANKLTRLERHLKSNADSTVLQKGAA